MPEIARTEGQRAFGHDPAGYDHARLEYPPRIYDILRDRCGLQPGARTFEVGPGTGIATRHLLRLGAAPLIAVEPDERLAAFLATTIGRHTNNLEVKIVTFEDVDLPSSWFDLGTAASVLHWLDEEAALRKAASILRSGGWWAMWWNIFGDPSQPNEFREATQSLWANLDLSPGNSSDGQPPFALDIDRRIDRLRSVDTFVNITNDTMRWTETLDTDHVMKLYATFPSISRLHPAQRQRFLEGLALITDDKFGGRVELLMVTPLYTAQRR
jgi:SAM-dependent methyltransferase